MLDRRLTAVCKNCDWATSKLHSYSTTLQQAIMWSKVNLFLQNVSHSALPHGCKNSKKIYF